MKHLFKNIFRFAELSIALFAIMLLCIHFWFKYNSERTIEQLISWASHGQLKCSIEKIETNYFHNAIHVQGISIFTVNKSRQSTSYKFSVKDFHFRTRSRWDLFVHRQLLIDSIVFNSPEIVIGKRTLSQADSTSKIALLDDLEKLYSSIYKSLDVLNLQLFKIKEGKLLVRNEDNPSKPPLMVNHIHFSINKLKIGSAHVRDSSQFIFSERVMLRISDQKIMFPDNKSNLTFKELLIDSKEKLVRLSGAAVRIYPSVNQRNSTDIRAGKLSILGLDFNLLYQKQLVKADSVFLENPFVTSELFVGGKAAKNGGNNKKALFDSTLNQLPVGFNIRHVVMQNGGVSMNLHQAGKITRFSAANDNVSISGFHLNDSEKKELTIGGFHYTIRNYTGFLPDSLLGLKFDSLQFINDKIILHNLVASTPPGKRNKVIRDYRIPRFEITGMDWLSFIFYNNFKARDAVMYRPVLRSEKYPELNPVLPGKTKRSVYQNLSLMDKIIDLEKLRIIQGDVSLKRGNNLELRLENLNLSIHVGKLGKARSPDELVRSVKQLYFGRATVSTPSVIVATGPSIFNEIGQKLVFDSVRVDTKNGDIGGTFKKVEAQDFSFENNQLDISRLEWEEGFVTIDQTGSGVVLPVKSNRTLWFSIEKMSGNNTRLHFTSQKVAADVLLENLSASKISREKGSNLQTEDLRGMGSNAIVKMPNGILQLGDFDIRDKEISRVRDIVFQSRDQADTLRVNVPVLEFTPYMQETLLTKKIKLDSVRVNSPRIAFFAGLGSEKNTDSVKSLALPGFDINALAVTDAFFQAKVSGDSILASRVSLTSKSLGAKKDSALRAEQINIKASGLFFNKSEDHVKTDGDLSASLHYFEYDPGHKTWAMQLDSLGAEKVGFNRNKSEKHTALSLQKLKIENLSANQNDLDEGLPWVINRSAARLQVDSLHLKSEKSTIGLGQLHFDAKQQQLTARSFSLHPAVSREDFYEGRIYRKIYLSAKTGEVKISGLELRKEGIKISSLGVDAAALSIYADKMKKFGPPVIQPLPVASLAKIGFPFQIDQMQLHHAKVYYTELSPISKDTGSVNFSSVNASIRNIFSGMGKNHDSLHVDVSALFLDKMKLQVAMNQSYRDTLGGLRLDIALGAGKFTELNPFLAPMLSARATSGYLDSMRMTAIGNDYVSQGSMHMQYHHFKAQLLDSGNVSRQKFRTKIVGFLANKIAIRNNNTKKEASFTFVRNRQKPVIVYFLRMVVGGSAGSIAPVTNIIFKKQYKKKIKDVPKNALLIL
ncbi:hypothetical protein ACFP1I_30480 [Dyadobacter subterraneus]|uniref:AsmA-like C-terminal domain-containing protein n=1 Tax=Dyadobacter subterraneus TaxID=2773304 RepID=A0ABR9WBP7_9BACT|nr:hypothetical protein [Dyadobacter subterraneus]MBE9461644.1 hypothetical protein [Dyadobacter subterraneus]